MKNYGAVIAKLRKNKGLTQGQLGRQLNVSYQAVSKWENNISEPDLQTIEKLTDIFEISMSDFFSMAKNPNEVNNAPSHKEQSKEPDNFIKTKPWILAVILGAIIAVLTLCALLIPVNYSSKQVFAKYDQSLFFVSAKTANGATKTC